MRAAIIGLPQSGKSTLFTAVSGQRIAPGDMPQERLANVSVPDPRVDFLSRLYKPKKTSYVHLEFVDVPGCSLADRHGVEEFRRHLPAIRLADVLVGVVRDFQNPAVPPYRNRVDPQADLVEVWEEFVFGDLEAVTNRTERLEKGLRKPSRSHEEEKRELHLMERCRQVLEDMQPVSVALQTEEERKVTSSFAFLTQKPWVVVYNVDESRMATVPPDKPPHATDAIVLCARTEADLVELEAADRAVFLQDLGLTEPAQDRLLRSCLEALGVITFLTVGDVEVHAWTIKKGATALDAAGEVHSDMARGFIRAEVVAFADLQVAGDMKAAKAANKVHQQGKGYTVRDGDVILIKFNV